MYRLSFEILQTCGAYLQALFLIIVSSEMLNMIKKSEVPKDMLVVDGIEDVKPNKSALMVTLVSFLDCNGKSNQM